MDKLKCEAPDCERDSRSKWHDGPNVCGMHYQRLGLYGSYDLPKRAERVWATCSIDGCGRPSRTVCGNLCETHYYRRYRTGTTGDPVFGRKFVASHGYVISYSPGHQMAGKTGVLYEHRKVLFDSIGGETHACHWCGCDVSWSVKHGKGKLVVDHLDNNKENNLINNLVPTCNTCNSTRGLFMSWVLKHQNDPFLLKLFKAANDNDAVGTGLEAA